MGSSVLLCVYRLVVTESLKEYQACAATTGEIAFMHGARLKLLPPVRGRVRWYRNPPMQNGQGQQGEGGAKNWLGLGMPLVWWVIGGYGVGSIAVRGFELRPTCCAWRLL